MFSVPGWNLSAFLAPQVETPKSKDANTPGKKALKRKRKREQQVSADNLEEQWEKSFGKGESGAQTHVAQDRRDAGKAADQDEADKKRKKRKRENSKGKNKKGTSEFSNVEEKSTVLPIARQDGHKEHARDAVTCSLVDTDNQVEGIEKKKKKHERDPERQRHTSKNSQKDIPAPPAATADLLPDPKGLTTLQRSMRNKLISARFRHLNESLYTKPSAESLALFQDEPSMFDDYHRGFAQQVDIWPENPVDEYVSSILTRGKIKKKDLGKEKKKHNKRNGTALEDGATRASDTLPKTGDKPLPRNSKELCTIVDLGCGTASLSYRLQPQLRKLNLTLHSFDLSKPSGPSAPLVTVADISALPLADDSVDVAIFCLALMGTNWLDFIDEAYRVLRWRGELWISEIKSRFGRVGRAKGGKVPVNSVGSLRKVEGKRGGGGDDKKKKKRSKQTLKEQEQQQQEEEEGIGGWDDEDELAVQVDGVASARQGTDVSTFIQVLRHRGFVPDAPPLQENEAVDLRNKMFVKMQFVKAAHPSRGKNAKEDQKAGAGARPTAWKGGSKMGAEKRRKEEEKEEEMSEEKERRVLHPCLYKLR